MAIQYVDGSCCFVFVRKMEKFPKRKTMLELHTYKTHSFSRFLLSLVVASHTSPPSLSKTSNYYYSVRLPQVSKYQFNAVLRLPWKAFLAVELFRMEFFAVREIVFRKRLIFTYCFSLEGRVIMGKTINLLTSNSVQRHFHDSLSS